MAEFIYNIINSQYFWFTLFGFIIISLGWKNSRDRLVERLSTLIRKPFIFHKDEFPDNHPFYPRRFLEDITSSIMIFTDYPLNRVIAQFHEWVSFQTTLFYEKERPTKTFGYVLFLVILILFLWADAVSVVNSLSLLGVINAEVPPIFTRFEIAVLMGTAGSVMIAGLILIEINSGRSRFSNWGASEGVWKKISTTIAAIIVFMALVVSGILGLQRYNILSLSSRFSDQFDAMTNMVIALIVPVNNVLVTMLISNEAILGVLVLLVAIQYALIFDLYILNFLIKFIGAILPFTLDVVFRVILIASDLLFYFLFTPIDLVVSFFNNIVKRVSG